MKLELMFALKNLKNKKFQKFYIPSWSAFFSIIALTLSIAILIIVTSVMNGFREELISKIIGFNSHITIYPNNSGEIENFEQISKKIENFPEIKSAIPLIYGQGMLYKNNETSGVMVKGFKKNDLLKRKDIIKSIEGNMKNFNDGSYNGFIGISLASKLMVREGDKIGLVVPSITNTIFGSIPRYKEIKIAGIINSGTQIYDASILILTFEDSQKIYNLDQKASVIEIILDNILNTDKIFKKLILEEGYKASNWENENIQLINALKVESNVMSLLLGFFVLISMFVIFTTINNIINEKEREIAILKSHGMHNRNITLIFFISGFFIVLSGLIFGNIIGIIIAIKIETIRSFFASITGNNLLDRDIYLLSYLPSRIIIKDIIYINIFGIIMSLICTIIPARKAAKQNPIEILRWL